MGGATFALNAYALGRYPQPRALVDKALAGLAVVDREVEALSGQGWFRECVALAMESVGWADVLAMDPVTRCAFLVTRGRFIKEARDAPPQEEG